MPQTPTGLFPVTDPGLRDKGRQKMHGLALYITHIWEATASTDTTLVRGVGLDVDVERIALEIAPALSAVRTLDLEVIRASQSPAEGGRYLALQDTDPQGQVVLGLVLARNADTHLPATLDLHVDRVVEMNGEWRVLPSWQPYDRLPAVVQASTGTRPANHTAYRAAVGGHLVIETLLDAFAFFLRCDPALALRLPGTGELAYFPLLPYATHDYERRHPDQPNRSVIAAEVRRAAEDAPPSGTGREILYRLASDGTPVYCGYTVDFGLRSSFTEAGCQIVRDLQAGFPYTAVSADGSRHDITAGADGRPYADGVALESYPFAQPYRDPRPETWLQWWQLTSEDAFLYRRQRHDTGTPRSL
ncbi:hypothetical protein GCM10022403_084050 [Streptomyces coacervatus]|uniref:Uncharacterized protein n=1 Tax=Streptomyces coacervatus TaxID=647381 RepID=A0ABP7JAT7_9ACTN|nr:hypothetical protein [Streptomyces coacervatus]MDF2273379.1 hypothetical protein [Streptomyces coacervatus]